MIQLCCPYIVPFLTHIINCCLFEGIFPDKWKIACVVPLAKISTPNEFKDLRPISILSVLSKVLEKIMDAQIRAYLNINQLFPHCQSGFRANYSCTTALINITDDIITANDTGLVTALVLLDFSKAFDTINHKILLAILYHFGFDETAISLLSNYLQGRRQCVVYKNNKSALRNLIHGVPQGSILGPLLYVIYSHNLCNSLKHCKYHQYADDTQIYLSFDPLNYMQACANINHDLDTLVEFAASHSLKINPSKSTLIIFGKSGTKKNIMPPTLDIKIKDVPIPCTDSARNLGVTFDSNLRFRDHVTRCSSKAYGNLKLLYSNRQVLNKNIKKLLCDSLVLSLFNYCDALYGPCLDCETSRKIQVVQNACLRFIYGIRRREHISHKLKEIKWSNMEQRRMLHTSVLYHKIITENSPPYLTNKIKYRSDVHNLNLRHRGLITPPVRHTEFFKRSFSFNIYILYNNLPDNFKTLSVDSFKRHMSRWLLDQNQLM